MDRYVHGAGIQNGFSKDLTFVDEQKPLTSKIDESETNSSSGGFDCNICLDIVQDPVVTFCGHLYCWPCIYRWITYQNSSPENQDSEQPQCPVCKVEVSEKTLVPLYGRGTNISQENNSHVDPVIPQRPKWEDTTMLISNITSSFSHPVQHRRNYVQPSDDMDPLMVRLGVNTSDMMDSMIGMFGEMVYARFFGNSQTRILII